MIPEGRGFVKGEMKKCGAVETPGGGNAAHQGEALAVEGCAIRGAGTSGSIARHLCDPTGARADGGIGAVPASYPRGVLRGERPKRVLVSFARSKETPSG